MESSVGHIGEAQSSSSFSFRFGLPKVDPEAGVSVQGISFGV